MNRMPKFIRKIVYMMRGRSSVVPTTTSILLPNNKRAVVPTTTHRDSRSSFHHNMKNLTRHILVVAVILCFFPDGISCYNLQRFEMDNGDPPVNVEIKFPSYETERYLEVVRQMQKMGVQFKDIEFEPATSKPPKDDDSTPLDSWSVVWYIASFGGLIAFFLIVSCSEWCCRRNARNSMNCRSRRNNNNTSTPGTPTTVDTPPPSYDEFAPPSYESICLGRNERGSEKSEYDIYVVPVHALSTMMEASAAPTEDAPPSYLTASSFTPAYPLLNPIQQNTRMEPSSVT